MVNYIDNSRYVEMIKNRPVLSMIPAANNRILSQRLGANFMITGLIAGFLAVFAYRQTHEIFSPYIYNTRKSHSFKADPYSGSVSCSYKDVAYKPSAL